MSEQDISRLSEDLDNYAQLVFDSMYFQDLYNKLRSEIIRKYDISEERMQDYEAAISGPLTQLLNDYLSELYMIVVDFVKIDFDFSGGGSDD